MAFTTRELNKGTWGDYIRLFSRVDEWDRCGCTAYHGFQAPSVDEGTWSLEVKRKLLDRGLTHGILVYADGEPVGWCQYGRRSELPLPETRRKALLNGAPGWQRQPPLGAENEDPSERVWRITCLRTRRGGAEHHVAGAALRAALDAIGNRGGGLVEGCPRTPSREGDALPCEAIQCGTVALFQHAGFVAPDQIKAGQRVVMHKLVPPRRPVGSTSERPRRQGVTHVPYAPEVRARAAELLRSGRAAEDVAQELGIPAGGAHRFFVDDEWAWATTTYPYLRSVHTREDVIDAVEAEFARLDRLATSLPEDDFAVPLLFSEDAIERWTVQDGLVHLTAVKAVAARAMAGRRGPGERELLQPPVGGPTSLSWPRQYPKHLLARPPRPTEALEWHWEVHADLMRALPRWLESRPAERLVSPWRGPSWFSRHERVHRQQMERALLAAGRHVPADPPPTPGQVVDRLCKRFDGAADPDLRATVQLDVTGKRGGRWWVRIEHGRCEAGAGAVPRPDMVVTTRTQELVHLGLGEVTPVLGAVKGTLRIAGRLRLGEALRVLSLFRPDYRWPNL